MEAKDLKLNNLVLHQVDKHKGDEVVRVTDLMLVNAENTDCVVGYECKIGSGTAPIESFSGIKLTEDWLLKFGFESNSYNDTYELWKGEELKFVVDIDKTKGFLNISWKHINIKYVHSLQNLYFCLCNQELKTKEI